jgi:hypothetical protein
MKTWKILNLIEKRNRLVLNKHGSDHEEEVVFDLMETIFFSRAKITKYRFLSV